jgi:hypothetical protein
MTKSSAILRRFAGSAGAVVGSVRAGLDGHANPRQRRRQQEVTDRDKNG